MKYVMEHLGQVILTAAVAVLLIGIFLGAPNQGIHALGHIVQERMNCMGHIVPEVLIP